MDWDKGMIYFRVTNVFEQAETATPPLLASLVRAAVVEMDRITPYLVVVGKTDPGEIDSIDVPAILAREDLLPDVGPAMG